MIFIGLYVCIYVAVHVWVVQNELNCINSCSKSNFLLKLAFSSSDFDISITDEESCGKRTFDKDKRQVQVNKLLLIQRELLFQYQRRCWNSKFISFISKSC